MKEERTSNSADRCHLCAGETVEAVRGYEALCRVTSDCQPWSRGGHLGVCRTCGCVQKVMGPAWDAEAAKIYEAYAIYHQSEGVEQSVFEESSGLAASRSERLLEQSLAHLSLPATGRLLDVGCGNGALLRVFSKVAPDWRSAGTELSDKYRTEVESIEGVEALYTCPLEEIPGTFDLITMVHVLEHLLGPGDFLSRLRQKLDVGGLILIEVPDYLQNPFDLVIADHCTHFTSATAVELVRSAGYQVVTVTGNWVPKELTLVACRSEERPKVPTPVERSSAADSVVSQMKWLESVVAAAREVSNLGTFGLFGTSIAATWLHLELEEPPSFFVDEDPHRAGKTHMGRLILHPRDVPAHSHIFLALIPRIAESVLRRAAKPGSTYHLPPPLVQR